MHVVNSVYVCLMYQIHRRDTELALAAAEEREPITFDIRHTAPQHRQYLEYGVSTGIVDCCVVLCARPRSCSIHFVTVFTVHHKSEFCFPYLIPKTYFFSPQQDTSLRCETMDTGLVDYVVCSFISQFSVVPTHRGMARLS